MNVKYLHSGMLGAPQINNVAGSRKAVLDACLVNGWGLATVDSVVIVSGIATVTIGAGHPFEIGSVALIAGASITGGTINGEQRVLSVTTTTYTFAAPSGAPNQTATGSITHKVAPLGWACPAGFSTGNIAAYHSVDPEGTGVWLRLDDSAAYDPRVRGYRVMTDHSSGTGPFPNTTQVTGAGLYWPAAYTGISAARQWVLCGDGRTFYFSVWSAQGQSGTTGYLTYMFGDFTSYASPDSGCAIINGHNTSLFTTLRSVSTDTFYAESTNTWWHYGALDAGGLVESIQIRKMPQFGSMTYSNQGVGVLQFYSGQAETPQRLFTYPNPAGGGLVLSPIVLAEAAAGTFACRGVLRGALFCLQNIGPGVFATNTPVQEGGRRLRAVDSGAGPGFFDSVGPW